MKYMIVYDAYISSLYRTVETLLNDGWSLGGGSNQCAIVIPDSVSTIIYYQVLVKNEGFDQGKNLQDSNGES